MMLAMTMTVMDNNDKANLSPDLNLKRGVHPISYKEARVSNKCCSLVATVVPILLLNSCRVETFTSAGSCDGSYSRDVIVVGGGTTNDGSEGHNIRCMVSITSDRENCGQLTATMDTILDP